MRYLVLATALFFAACSSGSDIQLAGPQSPQIPPNTSTSDTPATPSTPNGSSDDGGSGAPGAPGGVTPAPTPVVAQFRAFCSSAYVPYLASVSSLAGTSTPPSRLEVGEADARGKFDPAVDRNLEYHEHPQVALMPAPKGSGFLGGDARILFSARRVPKGGAVGGARFVFVSDVDLAFGGGAAKVLGAEVAVNGALAANAKNRNLEIRTFGVSDKGSYLLVGDQGGYRVFDSRTLKVLGSIAIGASSANVNPILRESDMLFAVAASDGAGFASKVYSVAVASGAIKSTRLIQTVTGLAAPLASVSQKAGESFAALDLQNRVAVLNPLKPQTTARIALAGLPTKGRVAPAIATFREELTRGLRATIGFENIATVSTDVKPRYKVEQVFLRTFAIDEVSLKADAITPDIEYPFEAVQAIESGIGIYGAPGMRELQTSNDGRAVFALFNGPLEYQVYRIDAQGTSKLTRLECEQLSVGRER